MSDTFSDPPCGEHHTRHLFEGIMSVGRIRDHQPREWGINLVWRRLRSMWMIIALFVATDVTAMENEKAGGLQLASNGEPVVVIGCDPGDDPASRHAADELSAHLGNVIGKRFQLLDASKVDMTQPAILVGSAADGLLKELGVDLGSLGNEGVVIRTHGKRLLISG